MDWESALSEGHEFLDEVCPLVKKDVEFGFLSFVVKGSLSVQWESGSGSSVVGGWKMMGASALFITVLSTMLELWESPLWFVQMVDLSLLSSRLRGENNFLEEGVASCQGVRVSVEVEVVLINVHSPVWVRVSHLVFDGGNGSVHSQGEDEARHGASLGHG